MTLLELAQKLKDVRQLQDTLSIAELELTKMSESKSNEARIMYSELEIELQQEKCASLRLKLAVLETIEIQTYNKFNSEIPF